MVNFQKSINKSEIACSEYRYLVPSLTNTVARSLKKQHGPMRRTWIWLTACMLPLRTDVFTYQNIDFKRHFVLGSRFPHHRVSYLFFKNSRYGTCTAHVRRRSRRRMHYLFASKKLVLASHTGRTRHSTMYLVTMWRYWLNISLRLHQIH